MISFTTLGPSLALGLALVTLGCESQSSTSTGPSPVKCQVSLGAPSDSIASSGGKGAISVTAQPECGWSASSDATWITGLTPSSGQGSAQVEFQATANPAGTMRQGHIAVNGQQVPVQQQPTACRFDVSPLAPSIDAAGGAVTIAVAAPAGCGWQANGGAGWIAITSTSGTGAGSVGLRIAPNGGDTRSATLLVAGQTVTVTQSSTATIPPPTAPPNCVFSLDRTTAAVSAEGAPVTVSVSGASGCARTATSQAAWITVVAGASGTGSGAVTFNVASNSGAAARSGSLTIAGLPFTVTQAAAGASATSCSYSIAPANQSVNAGGGAGATITISTSAGCAWTAISQTSWITVTSPASGTGSGTVKFTVAANTAVARSGTLAIAGQTFTINQASGCTYSINPQELKIGDKGGPGEVAVSAGAGCSWTATSDEAWITVTQGATGSGNGTVRFNVEAHTKTRSGTLTIAGRSFKVEQDKKFN